jgi:uncharacterized membrane protein
MNDAPNEKDIQEGKFFAIISYIGFLCIVSLLLKKDNAFSLFHAKQGLVLFVLEVAGILITIIPFFWLIRVFFFIAFAAFSLIGILQAANGSTRGLPVISELAKKVIL